MVPISAEGHLGRKLLVVTENKGARGDAHVSFQRQAVETQLGAKAKVERALSAAKDFGLGRAELQRSLQLKARIQRAINSGRV